MDQTKIELTYALVDELKNSRPYKEYLATLREVEANSDVQTLSEAFKESEEQYNEAKQYGKHHPDLKARQRDFQKNKKALFEHPLVKAHKTREKVLQEILDQVANHIAGSVSKRIKVNYNTGISKIGGASCKVEKA
jgi:cell fate (sporulation/competence/biofilm development) regulator YlbF (YheA/YmcA/DUF963 family)